MKILFVLPDIRRASGIPLFGIECARELNRLGDEVSIAVVNDVPMEKCSLDGFVQVPRGDVLNRIGAGEWALIHIHGIWTPFHHLVCQVARKASVPYVLSPHGMLTPWALGQKRLKKWFALKVYQLGDLRRAAALHVTADSEIDDLRRLGLNVPVIQAPLGVEVPPSLPALRSDESVRTLLFVSRVQKKKGLVNLIDAWAALPEKLRANWRVRIVGPDQDRHTAELEAQSGRLGVRDAFDFRGSRFGEELDREYAEADLFVLPTFSENFGSVVIEALARMIPVITTKGAPWQELEEWRCGWWIDIGVAPLVQALTVALAMSPDELREMGRHGRAMVAARYTWQMVARKLQKGYEMVVKDLCGRRI